MINRLRVWLSRMPAWILSGLIFAIILWLTLAPKPLGNNPPPLFPGADKIAHALMFGGFAVVLLLDWQRHHNWRKISILQIFTAAFISSVLGVAIEFIQSYTGRSFEFGDIIADISGAFVFALIYCILQKYWIIIPEK